MNQKNNYSYPLLDLHCHLDGSIPFPTMEKILGRKISEHEVQVSENCTSLSEYLACFDLPLKCILTADHLKLIARDFLLESSRQGLSYVETRFAPLSCVSETLDCRLAIESVLAGLTEARSMCDTDYGVIVCAMRHQSEEENRKMFQIASEFLGKGVVAADLAGAEALFPMKLHLSLFEYAKELGFPLTIHAGECGNTENIRDAISVKASRIGHGIAMKDDPALMKLCRDEKIGIELCPISNHQTNAIAPDETYPIRKFLSAGLLVTLNTDNRTVSNTTLKKEISYIKEHFGITEEEIRQMMRNALCVSFASPAVKEKLLKQFH